MTDENELKPTLHDVKIALTYIQAVALTGDDEVLSEAADIIESYTRAPDHRDEQIKIMRETLGKIAKCNDSTDKYILKVDGWVMEALAKCDELTKENE